MKIAMLAPPWIKVPPSRYGGIEWVVHYLTNRLVERGHDVTLFATGGSVTEANLASAFDSEMPDRIGHTMYDVQHAANCMRRADEFDIIHDHTSFSVVAYASLISTPVVHTLHGPFKPDICNFYRDFRDSVWYAAISDYQRSCCPELRYAGTVYNPIDINGWPYLPSGAKEDYLLAFGRLCVDKGFHTAIEVARRTGSRLIIAGAVQPSNRDYYETVIKPQVDGDQISFLGEVSVTEKWNLFSRARAFLFPIEWPEPFGLVMIEAMATGTPVIAFPEGSVPEVVEDGVTGFTVRTVNEMVAALGRLDQLDSRIIRQRVQERFSVNKCADGYEHIYEKVLQGCVPA
ncbi:MAG: glycosyltransferase family 4 protein [Thermoleophilia bacterium]|nr:glycosyltransferase family 4 protein [Thermoleophilia bacterium]